MKYTNEMHKSHKVMGLDLNSFLFLISMYAIVTLTTIYALFICLPMFFIFLSTQKKSNRGFIRHTLYDFGLDKVQGYPAVDIVLFHQ